MIKCKVEREDLEVENTKDDGDLELIEPGTQTCRLHDDCTASRGGTSLATMCSTGKISHICCAAARAAAVLLQGLAKSLDCSQLAVKHPRRSS